MRSPSKTVAPERRPLLPAFRSATTIQHIQCLHPCNRTVLMFNDGSALRRVLSFAVAHEIPTKRFGRRRAFRFTNLCVIFPTLTHDFPQSCWVRHQ